MKKLRGFTLIELLVVMAIIGILMAVAVTAIGPRTASACGFIVPCASDATAQQQQEQVSVTEQQNRLERSAPIPRLDSSLERINISKRLQLFSDESKISYIYLVSYGRVMAFYTVKGKITSGGKRLTSTDRLVTGDTDNGWGDFVMEQAELDGTYGTSGAYIFFWTTDGTYVQWNGEYMLSDQPMKLATQPELVRTIK